MKKILKIKYYIKKIKSWNKNVIQQQYIIEY